MTAGAKQRAYRDAVAGRNRCNARGKLSGLSRSPVSSTRRHVRLRHRRVRVRYTSGLDHAGGRADCENRDAVRVLRTETPLVKLGTATTTNYSRRGYAGP